MQLDNGGRLELKLTASTAAAARYRLSIRTPSGESSCDVSIDAASGALELAAWSGGDPPRWLDAFARSLLRTVVRNWTTSGEWPRRITRWRAEPGS